ncbi:MAG: prepilin peptidase [Acidimicrobiales bacterium]|nr:prepilin peptidase [Acidimicrobiales bacterium]
MGDVPIEVVVFLGILGLAVGSFVNVVIVRVPSEESLLHPPSKCPLCETPIKPRDNIPVLSWLLLRGKCRACGEPIPAGYPLVEAANCVLWVAAALRFGDSWAVIPFLLLFSTLLAQSVIDLELYRLLDRITFPVLGVSVVLIAVIGAIEGEPSRITMALLGAVGYFLFLFIPAMVYPKGMGLGDVKLALLMGLFLGWVHPVLCLYAVIVASVLGLVAGVILYFARGRKSSQFPFGPWLALGCVVVLLASNTILDFYGLPTAPFLA